MNRILKTLVIAATAISGAAFAQSDSAQQEVTGNIGDTISISVGQATNSVSFNPNTDNEVTNSLTVSATKAFTVAARSDNATMTEWNPTGGDGTGAYVTASKLVAAPAIDASTSGGFGGADVIATDLTTDDQVIFNGAGAVNAGTIDTTITQAVTHTEKLTTGNSYRMVVTYTATLAL